MISGDRMYRSRTRNIVLISLTVALTTAGAYLRVPVGPVPISLQTLFVLLSGALLGPRIGSLAMASYVMLGLIGLPLFTGGGGPQYIFSPTFGFLLSFPVSALVVGLLIRFPVSGSSRGMGIKLLAMTLGTAVIYLVGVPWLGLNLLIIQGKSIGVKALLMMGMVPFLPGDIVKILLATWLVTPAGRALGRG
jgi:biotin transport system substrate-specific component